MRELDRPRTDLYPPIEPRASGMLALDRRHSMYWEESGNPDGVPVLYLHGGPGGGTSPRARRFFDPQHYRTVLFDQRGAGRSQPTGECQDNTTPLLIQDIEMLRRYLGIERWLVFGGSWGSTLALAYGEAYPDRCLGFVLRGIFLCSDDEVEWFLNGIQRFFPEAWREFISHVPAEKRDDIAGWYLQALHDPDPAVHMPLARAWSRYEASCSALLPNPALIAHLEEDRVALGIARLESHYFVNRIFLPSGELLREVSRLRHLPCVIVQGRYDMICPIATADRLARHWPEAQYVVVEDAGHSAWEPGIMAALVTACEKMKIISYKETAAGPAASARNSASPRGRGD
jgi:proline iminopeptidase